MFRNRLKGGHKVGATNTLQPRTQDPSPAITGWGGWGMPPQQNATPMQPGQPPQPPVQLQQAPNSTGWGNEADNSWDWGEKDNSSNNSGQGFNSHQQHALNQQHQLNLQQQQLSQQQHQLSEQQQQHAINQQQQQHSQPPVPQYYNHESQAYPQQLQNTSEQELTKPTQNAIPLSNQHADTSSVVYPTSQSQPLSTNTQPQYVNGSSQNGNDEWGNDNWGNEWSQSEALKNNNKPANYVKQDQQHQQPYDQHQQHYIAQQHQYHSQQHQYQHQQHNEFQQNYQHDTYQQKTVQQQQQYEQQQLQQTVQQAQHEQQHQQTVQQAPHEQHQQTVQQAQHEQQHQQTVQQAQHEQQHQQTVQQAPHKQHQQTVQQAQHEQQHQQTVQQAQHEQQQHQQTVQHAQYEHHQQNVQQAQHEQQQHQQNVQQAQHYQGDHQNYYQHQQQYTQENKPAQPAAQDTQQQSLPSHQQQHEQMQAEPAAAEDAWGWDDNDWDVSKKEEEQNLMSYQQQADAAAPQPQLEGSSVSSHAQEIASEHRDESGLVPAGDPSQRVTNRDTAGDGWPDWESREQHPPEVSHAFEQQRQLTEQSIQPAVSEGISVPQQDEGQPQQNNYQWDDGLEHGQDLTIDATAVASSVATGHHTTVFDATAGASSVATGHHTTVLDSNQHVTVPGSDPMDIKQDSWGLDAIELESRLESIDAIEAPSNPPAVEHAVITNNEDVVSPHSHVQDQMSQMHPIPHNNSASATPQMAPENSVDVPRNIESQVLNSSGGLAMGDGTWDDDGWGDGWEAEGAAAQEGLPGEDKTEESSYGEEHQDHGSSQPANFSSADQSAEADSALQHHHSAVEGLHSQSNSDSQQAASEQSYHPAAVVSEAYQYTHEKSYEHPQNHMQETSASTAWESGWNQDAPSDGATIETPSNEAVDSITQEMDAMSLGQEQKEQPSPSVPSAYDQYGESDRGEIIPQDHSAHFQPSYQHPGYQMQPGMYPMPQGEAQPHPNWVSNQSVTVPGTESQHIQRPPVVEQQNRSEQYPPDGVLSVQGQAGLKSSPVPEVSPNVHMEMAPSPHPQPVPSPHSDVGQNSQPEPARSPHPQPSETLPSLAHPIPQQDPVHHYPSYQHNPHQAYHQYQGLNQEVVEEPGHSTTELDPMVSRIPDGASSVTEIPISTPVAAETGIQLIEEPPADLRNSLSETSDRPSSTQSAQSINSQHAHLPSQPFRPPSSHAYPERPASNQSAHSVHSVRSSHSVQSAYSNRSTQSSHSLLSQNQEVPPNEEAKMPVSQANPYQAIQNEQNADTLPQGHVASANKFTPPSESSIQESVADGGIDPAAPPDPVAPPPVLGPHGTVTSFTARKGSPFQPPSGKRPQGAGTVSQTDSSFTPVSNPGYSDDVSANLEMPPDNIEHPVNADRNAVPLWTSSENLTSNVKLAVAAPSVETTPFQPPLEVNSGTSTVSVSSPPAASVSIPTNPIPLVVPGMITDEQLEVEPPTMHVNPLHAPWTQPIPPVAHNTHPQTVIPKKQPPPSAASTTTPGVLDLSRSSRTMNESRGDGSQNKTQTPNFSRMVPGESCKGESASISTYQAPTVVPSMPSERVVTGNDNPQPVLPVRIKQEPNEVRSPPDGPYTSDLSGQGASVVPPVRSETIGSEEPTSRNFASANSGSRPDLTNDHRDHRGGRWESDHSRDRENRSTDQYRGRSREHSRDYYRDDSPHSRRSYDRDYDYKYDSDRRTWRHESDDDDDNDRRYYESRDRRDRAYRDELDRYSDRPIKDEKDRSYRESSRDKRRDYRDKTRDYRSYDDDPYYGRSDRSQPVSRSSSINNLDNEGDRSDHHRSRHDYYDRHDRRDSRARDSDPRDARSRDSDPRDREGPYSRNHRDASFSHDGRDARRDPRYYGQRGRNVLSNDTTVPPNTQSTEVPPKGYEEAYGSRELYDQYQYYYQYYRDHPYYKEYYRQWMKQYGHAYPSHESFYDDRTSIHSGRSSVNDELKKSISSGELSGVPSVGGDSASEVPQRLTPVQHGRPHINARFTPGGQLLLVLPKDPRDGEKAIVQLRDVQKMLCMDPSLNRCVHQMKTYPGPLTLADTHKDVVVRYCEQQAAEAAKNHALPDGESVTLIWEYLALLVKQNGKLYGSDVAGLLLKGQDRTSQPQPSASQQSPEDAAEVSSSDGSPQDEGIDVQSRSTPLPPARDESALLKKFTEYLCLGRKKEAVDYAMREGLWGHALALSYKMDSTTHTRVLAAFSNSIPRNDVLLTLFQQLSGKRPEVAKNYAPQQWGNWRQHLAMMVSNPTGQSQRDKASIVALGETLASRGQLHASHFCYLVAEAEWGCFSNKESKLVLIGSSHHLPFQAFATNEAIQCTEIFEFARSLDSSNPVLETFQSYKLIYALRLAEFGFPSEALRYCEVISQIVSKAPHSYQGDFLSQVYELGLRLKYHDLHYQMFEGEVAEMPDPKWLTSLATVVATVRQQEAELTASEAVHEYNAESRGHPSANAYQGSSATPDLYPQTMKNTTDNYQLGYSVSDSSPQQAHGTPDPYQGHVATGDVLDAGYPQQPIPTYPTASETAGERTHAPVISSEACQSNEAQGSTSHQPEGVPMMMQPQPNQSHYGGYGSNYWPGYTPQDPNTSSPYMAPEPVEASHSSLPVSPEVGSEHRANSVASISQPNSLNSYPAVYPQPPYQPWEQQQAGSNSVNQTPPRSPEPAGASHRTPEEEAYWAEMTGKKTSNDTAETTSKEKSDEKKNKDRDSDLSQDKAAGWSIGSLFGWKKSKQAVLPDDKNPSIVWNAEKKRWENKDGEEEVNSPPPPPPKFAMGGPGAPPITMTRAGPRKSRYVNTEKDPSKQPPPPNGPNPMLPPMAGGPPTSGIPPMPGGAPLPGGPPLPGAPMMPSGASTSPFMVPGSTPQPQEGDSNSLQPPSMQQPEQQPQKPLPQVPPTSLPDSSLMRRSRYISESSIELEEDLLPANTEGTSNDGAEGAVPMMAPLGQPQFFNPTQFNPATATNPAQTRRVGPGKRLYQGKR